MTCTELAPPPEAMFMVVGLKEIWARRSPALKNRTAAKRKETWFPRAKRGRESGTQAEDAALRSGGSISGQACLDCVPVDTLVWGLGAEFAGARRRSEVGINRRNAGRSGLV